MCKDYSDILYRVLEESMENLAFMFAESVDYSEISMNFTGDLYNGSLLMILPNNISNELAANILGIDDFSEEANNLGHDSLKEVLNVICGRVLTEIFGMEPLFDLSIPELEIISSNDLDGHTNDTNLCCAIIDDMYPIILKFQKK